MTMLMRITTCFNITGCLCAAFLLLMLLFQAVPAVAADMASDEFLTGYIASILERDMHWERDSYRLKVVGGVATITLFKDDPVRMEAADKQLHTIDGLHGIAIVVKPADAGKNPRAVSRFLGITGEGEAFPLATYSGRSSPTRSSRSSLSASTASDHRVCDTLWRQSASERHSACTGSSAVVRGMACS